MQEEAIKIAKVRIDKTTLKEATETALKWVKAEKQRHITTPNPEIILEANKNHKFLRILNHADLNTADGTGILWAAKYLQETKKTQSKTIKLFKTIKTLLAIPFTPKSLKTALPERVTGVDLLQSICKNAKNEKIFFLGAQIGVAEKTKKILEKKYPQLKIVGTHAGSPNFDEEKEIIEKINKSKAEILFIAYGAPAQEFWISRNLKKMPSVKVAAGIGGSFDFISSIKKRAPKWMQRIGIEWLYRLIQEPSRFKRIYNATIKFPLIILRKG